MTRGGLVLSFVGLCAFAYVILRVAPGRDNLPGEAYEGLPGIKRLSITDTLRFMAVGDVNLGRGVGQEILKGDTLYPFQYVIDSFARYDIVFANLESCLSDQDGETQNPKYNLVFTGPPAGAMSLRRGGVTVVSTANNHMLDYGVDGLQETEEYLREAGIAHAGAASEGGDPYAPAIVTQKNIRCAFFAVTDIMNTTGEKWKRVVAAADTSKLFPSLRSIRGNVDMVVVSFHGGEEYGDRPTRRVRSFAEAVIDAGADLFLGHHPHVTYGMQKRGEKWIVHSLGNFVFRQPQRYWTGWSYAFTATMTKSVSGVSIHDVRYIPVAAGFQPRFVNTGEDADRIRERTEELSWSDN